MIFFNQSRRSEQIGIFHRVGDLLKRDAAGIEFTLIHDDVKFAHVAARHADIGNAVQPRQTRLDRISRQIAQSCRVAFVGSQTVTGDRKNGERQTVNLSDLRGRRQADLRKSRLNELQSLRHVNLPVEKKIDVARAARSCRFYPSNARNAVHRLFNRTRHGDEHLVGGNHAVVYDDDDSREVRLRKQSGRQIISRVNAEQTEQHDHHDDRAFLAGN